MIDTRAIRSKILDLALRGKLTEQLPEDGTAEELIQRIQQERQDLVEKGIIKKNKSLVPITAEEIPYEIPHNWKWARLGEIITLVSGTDFPPEEYNDLGLGTPYMTGASNIVDDHLIINRWTKNPKNIANQGDVLLVCKGSGFGKIVICDLPEVHIARQFMAIRPIIKSQVDYIQNVLIYSFDFLKSAGKGLIPGVDRDTVLNLLIQLPPIKEQQRINDRLNELFSCIALIKDLQTEYQYNASSLKSKLIDAAIRGKLTEQLPEDGTGEELCQQIQAEKQDLYKKGEVYRDKGIKPITEDGIPFDIPESWFWCRLGDITRLITKGSSPAWQGVSYTDETNGILFVTSENVGDNTMLLNKRKYVETKFNIMHPASILKKNDILTNLVGASIGRSALFEEECDNANINQAVCIIRLVKYSVSDYVRIMLRSESAIRMMMHDTVDTARANLSLTSVSNLLIPLPPLAEQKRIVACLEELLPLCNSLQNIR